MYAIARLVRCVPRRRQRVGAARRPEGRSSTASRSCARSPSRGIWTASCPNLLQRPRSRQSAGGESL